MFKTSLQIVWIAIMGSLLLGSGPAFSQDSARTPLEDHLVAGYKGQQWMVQGCYCGKELKYDSKGTLVEGGQPGAWTICRDVRIDDIQLIDQKLQITGKRVYLFYDPQTRAFRDVDEIIDPAADKYKNLVETQQVKIEVTLSSLPDQSSANAALNEIFWPRGFKFSQAAPEIWREFFPGETGPPSPKQCSSPPQLMPKAEDSVKIMKSAEPRSSSRHLLGQATQPRLIYSPNPEFSDPARKARYQSTTMLKVLIGVDGQVHSIQILQPAGMGLDERAIETVLQWRFEPASDRAGMPVDAHAIIEVNFRLY